MPRTIIHPIPRAATTLAVLGFVVASGLAAKSDGVVHVDCSSASSGPFVRTIPLPEGVYDVTATFGDDREDSATTVKAESRRLMIENVAVPRGERIRKTFTVDVRRPRIADTSEQVRLKDRERATHTWDDALTLEFSGSRPSVDALEIVPATATPTVFLAGDSTVTDQPREPWASWGQMLPRFLEPGIAVANYAESGETVRSSLFARRFDKIFSRMRPGDYLVMQFGHNDMKDKREGALDRYRESLDELVVRTRDRGATPILVTSMERKAGVAKNTLGDYPDTVRAVARERGVVLVDLHAESRVLYRALGADLDRAFQDGSHHSPYGAYLLAKCVAAALAATDLPLAAKVTREAAAFDPAHPDPWRHFAVPPSPEVDDTQPEGD